jgi:hypothetical protein
MQTHSAAAYAVPPSIAHRGDVHQAEYYRGLLDELRAAVTEELAHHRAALARVEGEGTDFGVGRLRRAIKLIEAELSTLGRLADALTSRFPTA